MKLIMMCCLAVLPAYIQAAKQAKPQQKKEASKQQSAAQYKKSEKTEALMKENKTAFACRLSSPELQKRKATVIAHLKSVIVEKVELPKGFSYKFENTDATIDLLANFIKTERQCCDFFNFNMFVSGDQYILMDITGADGIKTFIHHEIGL